MVEGFGYPIPVLSTLLIKYFLNLGIIEFLFFYSQNSRWPNPSFFLIHFRIAIKCLCLPIPIETDFRYENA